MYNVSVYKNKCTFYVMVHWTYTSNIGLGEAHVLYIAAKS